MMNKEETIVTKKLLQLCYTCDHAHECETEEKSIACWIDNDAFCDEPQEADETRELLRIYAE